MLTSTPVLGAGPAAITPFAGPGVRTGAGRGTFDRQPTVDAKLASCGLGEVSAGSKFTHRILHLFHSNALIIIIIDVRVYHQGRRTRSRD